MSRAAAKRFRRRFQLRVYFQPDHRFIARKYFGRWTIRFGSGLAHGSPRIIASACRVPWMNSGRRGKTIWLRAVCIAALMKVPEWPLEAQFRKSTLRLGFCFRDPIGIETVAIPRFRQAPTLLHR